MDKVTGPMISNATGSTSPEAEYQYRPRVPGATHSFRLAPDALEWDLGRWSGRLPYRDVAYMRFSLRPTNLTSNRYLTEVRSKDGLKLPIASVSAKSMLISENRGPAYRAFVTELAARVHAAAPASRFEAGLAAWRWWPAVIFAFVTFGAVVYVMLHALTIGEKSLAVMMAIFGGLFIWQVGMTLLRNRPRVCGAAIPEEVLPK
jgi:hypothetical protein